ncbi:MAG: hypothetical protein J6A03_09985 [Lachnospiraceae bacterium]|nr:hypothetical protein [Lachnospiraceae bacterium]
MDGDVGNAGLQDTQFQTGNRMGQYAGNDQFVLLYGDSDTAGILWIEKELLIEAGIEKRRFDW